LYSIAVCIFESEFWCINLAANILGLQVSVGNVGSVLQELGKPADDSRRKGSPKKDKDKEPDTKRDSPKKKNGEVSFSSCFSRTCIT